MSETQEDPFAATATVVPGGNRTLRIVAHVVCRDVNGQVRWEEDAVVALPIPAGTEVPDFACAGVTSEVVPNPRAD